VSDLNEDARLLLEMVRDAHAPDDADRARVRAELAARIGTAAGLGLTAGLGAAAKTTATAVTGAQITAGAVGAGAVTAKLVGVALIVSATAGLGVAVVHHARQVSVAGRPGVSKVVHVEPARRAAAGVAAPVAVPAPEPAPSATTVPAPRALPLARQPARAPVTAAAPIAPEAPAVRAAPPVPAAAVAPAERAAPVAAAPPAPAKPPVARPAVDDEVALVHGGLVARRAGQPARALELLDRHASLYPRGVLAEERDAERALALADLGRVAEARAAIEQFLRAHPQSPLAARLRDRAQRLH